MDRDYLDNIAGSPFVNEGAFQQLKTKAAQGWQAGQAAMGQSIEPKYQTAIKSVFETFSKKLLRILNTVKEDIAPLLRHRSATKLTPEQNALLDQFTDLYYIMRPTPMQAHQLSKALKEDVGDIKAKSSNDPDVILNNYKDKVAKLFDWFLTNASQATKIPKNLVAQETSKIFPPEKHKNLIDKVQGIINAPRLIPKAVPGAVPPVVAPTAAAPTSATSPTPTPPAVPPVIPSTPPAAPTAPKATTGVPPVIGGTETSPKNADQASKDDLATIIDRTIDIIIDAVKSDISRAAPFIGPEQKPMPTAYGGPLITKEVEEPGYVEPQSSPKKKAEDYEEELEGEFLYNFHSKYNKFPGSPFSIEITPRGVSKIVDLPGSGKKKELTVLWRNSGHMNEIIVVAKPVGGEGTKSTAVLFKFYDDQVNPKTSTGKNFSLDTLMSQAHPMAKNTLNGANPKLVAQIEGKMDNLFRSLYATTYRKAMEFSPKKKGLITLVLADEKTGSVKDTHNKVYNQDQIRSYLNSSDEKEAKQWKDSLEAINYFEQYPSMLPKKLEEYPSYATAVEGLMKLGYGKVESETMAGKAWGQLKKTKAPDDITSGDIVNQALSGKPSLPPPPAALPDASTTPSTPPATAPEASPKKKGYPIKIWKDDDGTLMWQNKEGAESPLSSKKASHYMKNHEFAAAMKNARKNKFVKEGYEFGEEVVNPYQRDNFCLY